MIRLKLEIKEAPVLHRGTLSWGYVCILCADSILEKSPMVDLGDNLIICRNCARQLHYLFSQHPEIDSL